MSGTLNQKAKGEILFEIDFTPKGKKSMETVYVYAKDKLGASNYLILNRIFGKQHEIRVHSSNLSEAH